MASAARQLPRCGWPHKKAVDHVTAAAILFLRGNSCKAGLILQRHSVGSRRRGFCGVSAGTRRPFSRTDVCGASGSVLLSSQFCLSLACRWIVLAEALLQIGDTPAAPGPCSTAFAQLARAAGLMHTKVIQDLALRDMEAITEEVVGFHDPSCYLQFAIRTPCCAIKSGRAKFISDTEDTKRSIAAPGRSDQ